MICLYGVCVPLNMLLPFLVGLLHRYGYLKFLKEEWFTISYWKVQYNRWINGADQQKKPSAPTKPESSSLRDAKSDLDKDLKGVDASVDKAVDSSSKDKEGSLKPRKRQQDDL